MAFDGITTAAVVNELRETILGGGISRIVQSEKDELFLAIKHNKVAYKLVMSANASLPLIYLTEEKKEAPLTAPNFCMLLRKHIQGGQILDIRQPSLDRVIIFDIQHRNELGDLCRKQLILELMGKYSNIIFTDDEGTIIDSIKRVSNTMSSVREVLPGRPYFIPDTQEKLDPLQVTRSQFEEKILSCKGQIVKGIYSSFTGFSSLASEELIYEAYIDPRKTPADLDKDEMDRLYEAFGSLISHIRQGEFSPVIAYDKGEPAEYAAFPLRMYAGGTFELKDMDSMSGTLIRYYGEKEKVTRIRQKSQDLRHLVTTALDRTNKKCVIQEKQLKDSGKKEKYRIYGELVNAYGYASEEGAKSLTCLNYYTNEEVTIPLDPTLNTAKNAQKFFARYDKLKRTEAAVKEQLQETYADREQLEAILTAIDLAENEADLSEIRKELVEYGFSKKVPAGRKGMKRETKSEPYRYLSSDGFEMVVGRNNLQNEEVDFKIANGNDWWFHAKGMTGSHVIVRTGGREVPDRTFEEAGSLAAWYSSGRKAPKVEVDYTRRKELRKKTGGKPGFVVYHTNYSLMAVPDISGLERIK